MATILIVEDDEELQSMLKMMLQRSGHEVHLSPNGVDALYQVSYIKPELIVLDLMMPWASGDAVLGYVRSTSDVKHTRVLVLSAHPEGAKLANQLEADSFLPKPVDLQTFREHVDRLLQPAEE